ncbi:MAG TPA: exonuclease, partial [bacterium (Candidatus Stahlbacteria)]|nr:exonuclease [Candidatus Stahlbacteria bacterium]
PAALVPDFYATYLRTKNVGPLIAIIEHNRDDLITLASVFSKLCESCKDESYY